MKLLQGVRILVVDDEEEIRSLLSEELRYQGAETIEADNGVSAFQLFQKHPFDVILSDVRMPGGSGLDLLQNVRSQKTEHPVFALVTGFSDYTEEQLFDQGCDVLYGKPFDLELMIQDIKHLLEPRRQRWAHPSALSVPSTRLALTQTWGQLIDEHRLALGRGGFALHLPKASGLPGPGSHVDIQLGDQSIIQGQVAWLQWLQEGPDMPAKMGIRIRYCSPGLLEQIASRIEELKPRAFIPLLK